MDQHSSTLASPAGGFGVRSKIVGFAQLGKLRVYQHVYEWLLVVSLLHKDSIRPAGTVAALVLILVTMIAIQAAACAADDVVGFRNGSDADNYRSSSLLAAPPKMLPKPLLTGALTEKEAVAFAVMATLVALACAGGAILALGGNVPIPALIGFLVVLGCAVQYSWGFKFSYRPGGLEFVIFVVNAGTVLLPYWWIAHRVSSLAVVVSLLAAVWFLLVVSYGNAADREGDAAAGRRTFAVLASREQFRNFLVVLYVAAVSLSALPFALGMLPRVLVVCIVPLVALNTIQLYYGAIRGDARRAMRIGFRCIDVGGLGLATAILLA